MDHKRGAALVTGGGSGIGRACAAALTADGFAVVVADRDVSGGEETVRQIAAGGGRARFVPCDVRRPEQVEAAVDAAVDAFGGLQCAVNSAGVLRAGGTLEATPADWELTLTVNLTGVWHAMRAEIAHLLQRGGGAIVNVASIYGVVGSPANAAYTASKHGVVGLTRSAALQYAEHGVRINAVCPGHSHTPMTAPLLNDPDWLPRRLARYPMRRLAQPEETAEVVRWLCSDAASFVTGQAVPVDGGYTAQ
jgi:NAD(P)-dependent dehydrogenase (short-subunit alcohol dehydrogenase family)